VALDKPLAFRPGTQFLYSGTVTYNILRQIIEKTSQQSFSVLTKNLFKQAKMSHSLLPIDYRSGQLAEVYKDEGSQEFVKQKIDLATLTNEMAGAAIIATAQDLLNWNISLHQGKILQKAQYQLIANKNIDRVHAIWGTIGYSYGMQVEQNEGITELGHSGYFECYNGINYYCPATKTSLIVLANTDRFTDLKYTFDFAVKIRNIVRKQLLKDL
jgi:CubicO group peptidase (beta-lactamase class C family)